MKCSFIVSAFDRPNHLACLLRALQVQTEPDFEVLVADNSPDASMAPVVAALEDARFTHYTTSVLSDDPTQCNCYQSANMLATVATGEYLCFPSDDGYYVPRFLELMLAPTVGLTYCDMVYDPRGGTEYRVVPVEPAVNLIDKGGFLLRRDKFQSFPWQESIIYADGMLIERLVADGVSHEKVPESYGSTTEMNATVIIPSKIITNLARCMAAVHRRENDPRIIVIDDGLVWRGWNQPEPALIIPGVNPFIFARNVNLGIQAADPADVILLNDDATLQTPCGFSSLEEVALANPDYGVIAPVTDLSGNVNQNPQPGDRLRDEPWTLCFVCVYIRRSVINQVGLLDERFVTYGSEDNDYAHRVKLAGLKLGVFDGCFLKHSELRSTFRGHPKRGGSIAAGREIFKQKWGCYP